MGTTRKVLKKVAAKIESSARVYAAPDVRIPWTDFTLRKQYSMNQDDSILGQAFRGLPSLGVYRIEGNLSGLVDVNSIGVVLECATGTAVSTGVYQLQTLKNEKTMSVCAIDEVKTYKYAGCVINNIEFSSDADGRLVYSADVLGYSETRDGTSFPTISTEPGTQLLHRHAGGTGYMRVGDQSDALASGDNMGLANVRLGWNWKFANQYDNTSQGPLAHLSTADDFAEAMLSFEVSRHDSDTWLTWLEGGTALQAEFYYYVSATASLKFQIPNFIISAVDDSDESVPKMSITCAVSFNGIGASYENANMAFNDPIRPTVDNS